VVGGRVVGGPGGRGAPGGVAAGVPVVTTHCEAHLDSRTVAGMNELGTVLSVWAHPDDETYLAGAIMARVIDEGGRVVCVTATRGERGSTDPQRWPPGEPLAVVRTKELEATLAELGVTEHIWLDYPDGRCDEVDEYEPVERLAAIVTDVHPDTVLTFGPDGMTGHPDHVAVGRWITAALRKAGSDAALQYATKTPEWLARFWDGNEQIQEIVSMGGRPPVTPRAEASLHLDVEGELLERKLRAVMHQVSQVETVLAQLSEQDFRDSLTEETFRAP
jgi:LmbE family N-acetylglucosaminyl deacetylase